MISVVDTSVAVKWYASEPDSEIAALMLGRPLAAPDLIRAEVCNALWKKVRKGELTPTQARAALPQLARSVTLLPSEALAESALDLALELGHPIYDCIFLALAQTLDFPLITADKRLWTQTRRTVFSDRVIMLGDWEQDDD